MKRVDRILQRWRMRQALAALPGRVRLIDIGAHEGELFRAFGPRLVEGFGIEPLAPGPRRGAHFQIQPGYFPAVAPADGDWDGITLLAVLEHIPVAQQADLAAACHRLLRTGGRVVITVPAGAVDTILAALKALRLIDGMSLEEHFGFNPGDTLRVFAAPRFRLVRHRRFQLGLNHLFVFEKAA